MNLNDRMEFDHCIEVMADGAVIDRTDLYSPEVYEDYVSEGWTLLTGFTQQYGYNGPHMHDSEYVGGALERHILSTPGIYVVTVATDSDGEDLGWVVAFKESD